jgi:myosin-5
METTSKGYTTPIRAGDRKLGEKSPPKTSPRKAGERLAVFIPCKTHVWLLATCDASSTQDKDGNIEFTLVEDSSIGIVAKEKRLLNVDISSLPLHNINIGRTGVEDMCDLGFLHEASILDNLQRRFKDAIPYTRSGEICIAVNPYRWLDIYSEDSMENYAKKLRHEISPHVFATSAEAYRGLRDQGRNQSILVSGESGAGKTETVKIMLNMIAHVATPTSKVAKKRGDGGTIVQKIVSANPLLESFGNAKTARNDNSSRFGKFTELQFDSSSSAVLIGSKCTTYLLEKSRVITQNDHNERNYHVFYQLLAHLQHEAQGLDKLAPCHFKYLNCGDMKTSVIEGKNDLQHYQDTVGALSLLGVSNLLRKMLEDVLLGILYLGEMEFAQKEDDVICVRHEAGTIHGERLHVLFGLTGNTDAFDAQMTSRSIEVEGKSIHVPLTLDQAVASKDALAKEIYARLFQWLVVVINHTTSSRSSASVDRSCSTVEDNDDMSCGFGSTVVSEPQSTPAGTIALLDIFGFESFKVNRFEQLCINYANEKLQQKFCLDCFRTVQQEYRDEGLQWEAIPYNDNIDTLCMLEGGGSIGDSNIVAVLNEECVLGARGSDEAFLTKIKTALGGTRSSPGHKAFSWNVKSSDSFIVHHYAGRVEYTVSNFLEKNRDTCPLEIHSVLAQCKNPLLATLFGSNGNYFVGSSLHNLLEQLDRQAAAQVLLLHKDVIPSEEAGATSVASIIRPAAALQPRIAPGARSHQRRQSFLNAETVTSKFKTQLGALLMTLSATQCQYVRCIKPNVNKSSTEYSLPMVVSQLRSAGMIEAIRISRAAYPYRITHGEFLARFSALRSRKWLERQSNEIRAQAGALLIDVLNQHPLPVQSRTNPPRKLLSPSAVSLGAFSAPALATGSSLWELGKSKLYFTAGILEHLEALRSDLIHETVCRVQALYRGMAARRHFLALRRAAIFAQTRCRGMRAVRAYQYRRRCITRVQSVVRGWIARTSYRFARLDHAATVIACTYRMLVVRRYYLKKLLPACLIVQSIARMRLLKRKYVFRRDNARRQADVMVRLALQEENLAFLLEENARLRNENAELRAALSEKGTLKHVEVSRTDACVGNTYTQSSVYTSVSPRPALRVEVDEKLSDALSNPSLQISALKLADETLCTQRCSREDLELMRQEVVRAELAASTKSCDDGSHDTRTLGEADTDNEEKKDSPAPRIHKRDVKELLRLMETGTGLSCTVYAVQKKGGSVVGKPAVIKKCIDSSFEGGARIDVEVRTPSPSSANGYTGVTGTTPKKSADIISLHHPAAAPTIKVLRFGVADMLQVRRGRCGLVQLPSSVSSGVCLVVTVRNKGELNFVLDSKLRCEVAYVAFHYMMQQCGSTPSKATPSPVRSPISNMTPNRSSFKVSGLQINTDSTPSGRLFRSPLLERAQRSGVNHSLVETDSFGRASSHTLPPAPPALPFGTVLTSPYGSKKDKENIVSPVRASKDHHQTTPKGKNTLGFTDTIARDAITSADELLAEDPLVKKAPSIARRGWVTRDSAASGLTAPHWQRRYLMLERETRLLKFSQSELAEHYPSQVRSLVALSPSTSVKVSKGVSSGFSSYFSAGASILEIITNKLGDESVVKLQFESHDDLASWKKAIEDVVAGIR